MTMNASLQNKRYAAVPQKTFLENFIVYNTVGEVHLVSIKFGNSYTNWQIFNLVDWPKIAQDTFTVPS